MRYFVLIFALALLVSCANTADTSTDIPLLGEYRVTGINGVKISQDEIMMTFDPVGNRVSGTTGCNNFSANYSQEGQKLDFSTPMNTRKFCEGRMHIEKQILSYIEKASRLEFDGNEVLIYAEEEKALFTLTKMN